MDPLHARADWERVGDRWFRKTEQYTAVFDPDLDLDAYVVTGAPYAGALALWRDETKLHAHRAGDPVKPAIDIYTLAGKRLRSIPWEGGPIRGLGWSEEEALLVVAADGGVRCYDIQGDFSHFSLGHGAETYGVESCRFYNTGLVALLGNKTLVTVSSYAEPRPKALAALPEGEVHAWAVVSPDHTLSRSVEVLASLGATVHVVDAQESEDKQLDIGPLSHISVSPDGRLVNLYGVDGRAHVVSSDFQERLLEHDSASQAAPKYVEWCGADAVIAWEDEVHVIGPGRESTTYLYDSTRVHVVSECDGARLISNEACEFLERVPEETLRTFGAATEASPAAVLLDAVRQLELGSPKADDYIQLIRGNLTEAVDGCVSTAGREFDAGWQKRLLRAASLGKSVLDTYNSDEFVDMCETLRVLNAARRFGIGMPLSLGQYQRLTPERLVQRLVGRHEFLLAAKVAGHLGLPTDRVYVSWAAAKVRVGAGDDEATCRAVVERLSGRPGVSFEAIARAAHHEGRARLATALLEHEPRGGRTVPLLLDMEEEELALDKAVESGDTDLVLVVVGRLRRKLPLAGFFRAIGARPAAAALVEAAALAGGDHGLLKDMYYQDDRRADGAGVFVRESLAQPDARTAADKLALAAKLLAEARETAGEVGPLREATGLLRAQEGLERELGEGEAFTGLSVNETLFKLVRLGFQAKAKKLQGDFRVPDKVAWWIRLRALVAKREWGEIEEMGKAKRSPIGWEPFFQLTLQAGNPRLAAVFVPKCSRVEAGETVGMYEKCGMRVKAAEEAVRLRDAEAWQRLVEAARGTPEGPEIERLGAAFRRG